MENPQWNQNATPPDDSQGATNMTTITNSLKMINIDQSDLKPLVSPNATPLPMPQRPFKRSSSLPGRFRTDATRINTGEVCVCDNRRIRRPLQTRPKYALRRTYAASRDDFARMLGVSVDAIEKIRME
jgi:hypothetical protein